MVAKHLEARGFAHVSTGDLVREAAAKRKIAPTRENLQNLGNWLRAKNGIGHLALLALAKYPDDMAVSGIRHPGERDVLAKRAPFGFVMIAIDAPVEKRYEWAKNERKRLTDGVDFATFVAQQKYEINHTEKTGQQLGEVMATADVRIENNGTLGDLFRKVDEALVSFDRSRRLNASHYFLETIWRKAAASSWSF